jgi:hypothetical protein
MRVRSIYKDYFIHYIYFILSVGEQHGWQFISNTDIIKNSMSNSTSISASNSGRASSSSKIYLLSYAHLISPNNSSANPNFMKISYEYSSNVNRSIKATNNNTTNTGSMVGIPKVRCWTLCNNEAKGKCNSTNDSINIPGETIICRNNLLTDLARGYITNIVKIIETETGKRVCNLDVVVLVQDITNTSTTTSTITNVSSIANTYKLWLHHTAHLHMIYKNNVNLNVEALSTCSNSMNTASATSIASIYIKPSKFCGGDFCQYLSFTEDNSAGGSSAAVMDGMNALVEDDTDFDIKEESQRAIVRHRRPSLDSNIDGEVAISSSMEPVHVIDPTVAASLSNKQTTNPTSSNASSNGSTSSVYNIVALKEHTVLNRSVASAREEMLAVESIEDSYNSTSNSNSSASDRMLVDMKERLAKIWPMNVVRYYLTFRGCGTTSAGGSGGISKHHRLGKLSVVASKAPLGTNITNTSQMVLGTTSSTTSAIDGSTISSSGKLAPSFSAPISSTVVDEEVDNRKWFTYHHNYIYVCESCYIVYNILDKHRNKRLKSIVSTNASNKIYCKEEERDLERRIFDQRKLCSKLSRPRSFPDDLLYSSTANNNGTGKLKKITKPRNLPPLHPSSGTNDHLLQREPSLVQHIIKKPAYVPDPNTFSQSMMEEIENQWRRATEANNNINYKLKMEEMLPPLPKVQPVGDTRKPKVQVGDYSAERLLHPWQREFQRMKKLMYSGNNGGNPSNTNNVSGGGDSAETNWNSGLNSSTISSSSSYTSTNHQTSNANHGSADNAAYDPFAEMIGLGSRGSNTISGVGSMNYRPSTQHNNSRQNLLSPLNGSTSSGRESSSGSRKLRTATSTTNTTTTSTIYEEHHDEEEDDEEEEEVGAQLGWNPFVLTIN